MVFQEVVRILKRLGKYGLGHRLKVKVESISSSALTVLLKTLAEDPPCSFGHIPHPCSETNTSQMSDTWDLVLDFSLNSPRGLGRRLPMDFLYL